MVNGPDELTWRGKMRDWKYSLEDEGHRLETSIDGRRLRDCQ